MSELMAAMVDNDLSCLVYVHIAYKNMCKLGVRILTINFAVNY